MRRRSSALAAGALAALAALPLGARSAHAQWPGGPDEFSAPRTATVDARGARRLSVEGTAGGLRIRGVDGLTEVRVRGTARASRRTLLDDIRLIARREGTTIVVRAEIPDWQDDRNDGVSQFRGLDLVLEVPRGIAADVTDGSGEIEIRGLGALELRDGSGEIDVEDVESATIEDGSGEIRVRDVRGDLRLSDGSGSIDVSRVRGAVVVERDGSGGVDVRDVGGDFTVANGRGRGIHYSEVRGRVSVPADQRSVARERQRERDRAARERDRAQRDRDRAERDRARSYRRTGY